MKETICISFPQYYMQFILNSDKRTNFSTKDKIAGPSIVYEVLFFFSVTQWEPPVFPQAVMPPPPPPPPSRAPITSSAGATTMSDSLGTAEHSLKRPPPDQAELGEGGTVQHPARRKGPYGEWNTIAVIEKDEDDDTLDDQGSKKEGQEQEVEGGGADGGIQFEEKKISGDLADVDDEEVKEGFKGFAFKKRTTTKERPQTRQRTSDV